MITVIRAAAVLGLSLAAAAPAAAQSWNNVKALSMGTEVRILAGARTISGPVQSVTDDSLVVNSAKGQEMLTRQEVTRLSARKNGHRGRNALIGLGIGAGAGLGIGAAADNCQGLFCGSSLGKAIFTPLGAVAGLLVGAVIPTGGWRDVYKQ